MRAVYCPPQRIFMSGIAGFWNLDGQPASYTVLAAMSHTLAHRGQDAEGIRTLGSVGLTCRHRWVTHEEHGERQPVGGSCSPAMLLFDGRLDNRDDLIKALRLPASCSDAALALAAYDNWTTDFAARLSGDFAAAVFDPARRQIVLARDAVGIRPLYYTHTPRLFAFASEIKALFAHPDIAVRPDPDGIADLMLVGSRPLTGQDMTCFAGVRSVVPAHVVTVTPESLAQRRCWDFPTNTRVPVASFEEYVDGFRECFTRAVKRRLRSAHPVAVSISGGLDSSSIFCAAETLRRIGSGAAPAIAGVSYVSNRRETDEQRFLREIETQYGVTFDRFDIEPRTGLVQGAAKQVGAAEAPFVDYMWGVTEELHARARAAGARTLLSGHWGDQMLFSSAYLTDLLRRGALRSIWQHTRTYARYFGDGETRRARRRLLINAARDIVPPALASPLKWLRLRFVERPAPKEWFSPAFLAMALKDRYRLATFDRPFHSAHARAVYLEARSKYHVQCMEWNNKTAALHGLDAAFPFLDRDLIAYLMAIPGEVHARDGVPRALLREATRGILPDAIRARAWKADFTALVNEGLASDASTILRTLHDECLGVRLGYLDRARLRPALARVAQSLTGPDCVASWDLADTYGLEVWLQVFLGAGCGPPPQPHPQQENTSHA
jgi:asparagine synthase (glutamine-hydrolysing)